MVRKISLLLTMTAWLFATGAQWDFLQTVAWARMFTNNVRTLPVDQALARTFSPGGRCALCKAISAAKRQQQEKHGGQTPGGKEFGKNFSCCASPMVVVLAASDTMSYVRADFTPPDLARSAPPVPPPRA